MAFVYYSLANDDVLQLCDIMCGRLTRASQRRAVVGRPRLVD